MALCAACKVGLALTLTLTQTLIGCKVSELREVVTNDPMCAFKCKPCPIGGLCNGGERVIPTKG